MNNNVDKEYVEIGKIVNTFGIKGELKITSDSDFVDYRFRVNSHIYLKIKNIYKEVMITSFRIIKGNIVITIDSINDINQVIGYIGCSVYALKDDIPPLEEGEYMIDDLVGLAVYNEEGIQIGNVNDVLILPTQDILEINQLNSHKKLLIPNVDEYVLQIDEDKIVIRLLEVDND